MGTFGEYIKSALSSIKNNKGRSFLTMLGIIIGISAVLTVLVIGDGMKETVNGEIDSMGATTISVNLNTTKTDKTFDQDSINTIEENLKNIYGVAPSFSAWGYVKGKTKQFEISINGTSEAAKEGGSVKMVHGRYFTKADVDECKQVCVISQMAADYIFGYENVVGKTIELTFDDRTSEFTIVGVTENTPMDIAYGSYSQDPSLMGSAPYTSFAKAFNWNVDNFTSITIYLDSEYKNDVLMQARSVVENVMSLRGENAVKISSGYGIDQTSETILNIITSVVAIIAAISLLVGGIGVMNIMTVSVTERTREIGIRKSLGARTSSILVQFLAEAAILTFTGGIIGIILGLSLAYLICSVIGFSFVVNPLLIAIVVAISTAIGLFFGIYPAKRAAKLDPIEALRTE
ncbi:MAG: FtsX-like permease family protein [Butyrivibrio sp.]|jgi:putative ABC transport system permease protein|uniref:ABC transporter permease n=1 Tax=Butyrivibrio sp. TaxID=28121 RepID=UPI001ECCBAE2|nr:ABC transporter permease [Butyrivibrio sp.]MBE5840746.1 FtsX-like permease family protein [Butyrivibrio sp.]